MGFATGDRHTFLLRACVCAAFVAATASAEAPPALPGDEITGEMSAAGVGRDTALERAPAQSPYAPEWYVEAVKSWDAPTLSQQIDEEESSIPLGKGAVFVPRMSDPSLEPDVQIADSTGKVVLSGKPGKKFCLIPGIYNVHIGTGSTKQRIVKSVIIDEGKTTALYPTWAGLQIDVVNENNIPFRGSYEMARLDEFEPFGRTYGRNPNLGERVKTWILKPGLYKIFGVGSSYNAVNNYVTVRLLPGEMVHFVLVEDENTERIVSGGVTKVDDASTRLARDWKYGLDLGGSLLFNTRNDTNNSAIALLSTLRLNYKKGKGEWDSKIFFAEEFNFKNFNLTKINYTTDDFRITSLYVWRFMQWLGPYGRLQFQTHFFPTYDQFEEASTRHLFVIARSDSTIETVDSTSSSLRLQPSLSPMITELGVGANVDVVTNQWFDSKFKLGFGYSQRNSWNQEKDATGDTSVLKTSEMDPSSHYDSTSYHLMLKNYMGNVKVVQHQDNLTSLSYGPEMAVNAEVRLGGWGMAEGELIMLIPVVPLIKDHRVRPNYTVNTTVSWRITRSITLDYLFNYKFETENKIENSQHRIWLRFSFNTSK
jgi:hypothetical protein